MSSVLPDVVMSYLDCDSGSARRAAITWRKAGIWPCSTSRFLLGKSMPVQMGRYRLRLLTRMKRNELCRPIMLITVTGLCGTA